MKRLPSQSEKIRWSFSDWLLFFDPHGSRGRVIIEFDDIYHTITISFFVFYWSLLSSIVSVECEMRFWFPIAWGFQKLVLCRSLVWSQPVSHKWKNYSTSDMPLVPWDWDQNNSNKHQNWFQAERWSEHCSIHRQKSRWQKEKAKKIADESIILNHPKAAAIRIGGWRRGRDVDLRIRTSIEVDDEEPWTRGLHAVLDHVVEETDGSSPRQRCTFRGDNALGIKNRHARYIPSRVAADRFPRVLSESGASQQS